MKIGFFTDAYFPQVNGVTTSVYETAKELRKNGHEVFIIAPKYPNYKDEDKDVIRLSSMPLIKKINVRLGTHLPEKSLFKLYRKKFDIIHGHNGGTMSLLGLEVAVLQKIPFVFTYHTLLNKYAHYLWEGLVLRPKMIEIGSKIFCNQCNAVIAPAQKIKDILLSYGVKKPIFILPTGLDIKKFEGVDDGYLRKRLHLKKSDKILLYVGRLGQEKSVDFIVKAFKRVLKKNKNVVLVLVGDGHERGTLESLALDLGIKEKIFFTGNIISKDMPRVYKDSDIFVFASQTETQGLCVLEAAASGIPAVVIKDAAFENLAIDGKTGFSVPANLEVFAEKVAELLKDDNLRQLFGKNAKEMVKNNFGSDYLTRELLQTYKKILVNYKPGGEVLRKINSATLVPLFRATMAINKYLNS